MNVYDKHGAKNNIEKVVIYVILILFTFMALYPLLWLFLSSLKTTPQYLKTSRLSVPLPAALAYKCNRGEYLDYLKNCAINCIRPESLADHNVKWATMTFVNYPRAWQIGHFGILFFNSILYTGITTIAILYFSIAAGFSFSKLRCKATGFIYKSFVIGVLITLQCILIPLFFMANWSGLYNTRVGILICYIGIGLPMGVYLATEFVRSIPTSLIESARIDGAQFMKIFVSIIFPMAKPVGVTLAILNIAGTWNEFMLVNILASDLQIKSLPVGIQSFSGALASDYGKQFAALIIGVVPMIVFYIIFRKQITKGVAAGAVKG